MKSLYYIRKFHPRSLLSLIGLTSCLLLSACGEDTNSSLVTTTLACNLKPIYDVQYIGHAFGKGSITFSENAEKPNSLNYAVSVYTSQKSTPDISIKGVAQCVNGVVTGQFGGGQASKASLSILGGNFEGIFQHRNIAQPFGRWEIQLFDSEKQKNYDLKGYWQESNNATNTTTDIAAHQ